MCMHHAVNVRAAAINQQVHLDLTGHVAAAADFFAFVIADHQVIGLHSALRHGGGRGENAMVVEPCRDVAVKRRDKAQAVNPLANLDDFTAQFVFGSDHAQSVWRSGFGRQARRREKFNRTLIEGAKFVKQPPARMASSFIKTRREQIRLALS